MMVEEHGEVLHSHQDNVVMTQSQICNGVTRRCDGVTMRCLHPYHSQRRRLLGLRWELVSVEGEEFVDVRVPTR